VATRNRRLVSPRTAARVERAHFIRPPARVTLGSVRS
jgi:hypothetical protein